MKTDSIYLVNFMNINIKEDYLFKELAYNIIEETYIT